MKHIHTVASDGECLFNAVAYGMIFHSNNQNTVSRSNYKKLAKQLRKQTVLHLRSKIVNDDFDFIVAMSGELNNENKTFDLKQMINRAKSYITRMSKSCTWGGQIELMILGNIVHEVGFKGIKVYNAHSKKLLMKSSLCNSNSKTIHLVLHGVCKTGGGGIHFDFWNKKFSISKKSQNSSIKN